MCSFRTLISDNGRPIFRQRIMLVAAVVAVAGGIIRGIERINRWLMPILAILIVLLAVYALILPNADRGLHFLFEPDWSIFTEPTVYIAALGQAFFSIGLGIAIFITFGSYMPANFSVSSSATITALGDSFFAIIVGIAIFPAVFSYGVDPKALAGARLYHAATNISPNAGWVLRRRHIFPVSFRSSVFIDDGAFGGPCRTRRSTIRTPQTNRYNGHRYLGLRARTSSGDELRALIGHSDKRAGNIRCRRRDGVEFLAPHGWHPNRSIRRLTCQPHTCSP